MRFVLLFLVSDGLQRGRVLVSGNDGTVLGPDWHPDAAGGGDEGGHEGHFHLPAHVADQRQGRAGSGVLLLCLVFEPFLDLVRLTTLLLLTL